MTWKHLSRKAKDLLFEISEHEAQSLNERPTAVETDNPIWVLLISHHGDTIPELISTGWIVPLKRANHYIVKLKKVRSELYKSGKSVTKR